MSDDNENSEVSYVAAAPAPEPEVTATTEDVENDAQEGQEDGSEEQKEQRTFTQEEVNRIAQENREKGERKARRDLEARNAEAQRPANGPIPTRDHFPAGEAGDTAFFNAAVDYTADQKVMQREQQNQEVKVKTVYQEREEGVREKYPDFQDVVYKDPDKGGPAITPLMKAILLKSEHGPEMVYHLGKNVNESHRIYEMDPIDQVKAMTKLELEMSTKTPAKKTSGAPAPIKPVSGGAPVTPKYGVDDPRSDKSMTHAEWIAQRNKTASR